MKALVDAFNQEKGLVGAFSVIVQPVVEPMEHYTALITGWPNEYIWTGDRTTVNNDNWPTGYPHSEVNGVNIGTMVALSNFTSYIWTPNYPSNYDDNYYQVKREESM